MPRGPARNRLAALLLAAALCAPPRSAFAAAAPKPDELLDAVVDTPDVAYEGKLLLLHWYGKQSSAEELNIYRGGADRARREFLAPDGSVKRVIITNGDTEEVLLLKQKKVLKGDAAKTYDKVMPAQTERALLEKNYVLSVEGTEKVAGRPAWILQFKPLSEGKPWQRLWIDQATKVILKNRRYLPGKPFAELSRFTEFKLTTPDDALFSLDSSTQPAISAQGLQPDFMSLAQLNEATDGSVSFPSELPGGFEFESADILQLGRHTVRHARYTDGLAIVSLFETDKPVRLPKEGTQTLRGQPYGRRSLRLSSVGKVMHWQRGRKHYTLMSDVSRELLLAISSTLR